MGLSDFRLPPLSVLISSILPGSSLEELTVCQQQSTTHLLPNLESRFCGHQNPTRDSFSISSRIVSPRYSQCNNGENLLPSAQPDTKSISDQPEMCFNRRLFEDISIASNIPSPEMNNLVLPKQNAPSSLNHSSDRSKHFSDEGTSVTSIPPIANPSFNYYQLQPIRIVAYQVGINKDPSKSWRYRDIRRALFEKLPTEQLEYIQKDPLHSLLKQRLPHKLSLVAFCKRIMLLVFHFIVRDGREPKFWRKKEMRQDLVKKILQECDPVFCKQVNSKVAVLLHSYISAGMTIPHAMKRIEYEGIFEK